MLTCAVTHMGTVPVLNLTLENVQFHLRCSGTPFLQLWEQAATMHAWNC